MSASSAHWRGSTAQRAILSLFHLFIALRSKKEGGACHRQINLPHMLLLLYYGGLPRDLLLVYAHHCHHRRCPATAATATSATCRCSRGSSNTGVTDWLTDELTFICSLLAPPRCMDERKASSLLHRTCLLPRRGIPNRACPRAQLFTSEHSGSNAENQVCELLNRRRIPNDPSLPDGLRLLKCLL